MNKRRSLHERLCTQKALIGFMQTRPYPELAELAGLCGYDFLLLDDEHGLFAWPDYAHTLQAIAGVNIAVMVRLSSNDTRAVLERLPLLSTQDQSRPAHGAHLGVARRGAACGQLRNCRNWRRTNGPRTEPRAAPGRSGSASPKTASE